VAKYIEITDEMTTTETKLAQYQNCWEELQQLMVEEVLPAIRGGRAVSYEVLDRVRTMQSTMLRHAERIPSWANAPAPNERIAAFAPRSTLLQEKVDAWLREKVEEFELNPELLDKEGQTLHDYTYKRYETRREWLEGCENFKLPVRLMRALESVGVDLDSLKEQLFEYCAEELGFDLDVDDGETVDSHDEVRRRYLEED